MRRHPLGLATTAGLAGTLALAACSLQPPYRVPDAPTSPVFKEAEGWTPAAPADALDRDPWWTLFDDPVLDGLMRRVADANQNVAVAAAAYEQARALLRGQRAALFPQVTLNGGATRSGTGAGSGAAANAGGGSSDATRYQLAIGGTWEPDVWGRLRGAVTEAGATAEATAADLGAATLSAQGELAAAYFGLRQADAQKALLDDTIAGYTRSLTITRNRYAAGVVPRTDVLQAETQLTTAQADRVGLDQQRAQYEHAIAVLVGQAPGNFTLVAAAWQQRVPEVPVGVPSTLLQRRPDIAAAERRVAAANAEIGVARSAYFPSFGLNASYGVGASRLPDLFNASSALWSFGLQVAQTVFDAGATGARVDAARAAQAQAAARYRQTVLQAFQAVEDQLAAARVLERQYGLRQQASQAADLVEVQINNRYRAGQVSYSDVVTAQATALNARRALVQATSDRQTTAVTLIQALGGGWQAGRLPSETHP